jgi:hypothetical protein
MANATGPLLAKLFVRLLFLLCCRALLAGGWGRLLNCYHGIIESGHLALPDVLAARAGNRLRGMFLCQRLPTDGTIFTPHIGSAFSSTKRCNAGGHVTLSDHFVEFFPRLKCCEKRERFSVGCYRSG